MTSSDPASGRPGRAPLGSAYWWLWTSSGLSNLADGVFKIALPLVAIRYTQSPALIAGLSLALTLPWLLFALQAGALADRADRRRMMLGANIARTAVLAGLAVAAATGLGSIWVLYLVALCIGVSETLYDTSAQSILPQLVGRDQLSRANGRLYAAEMTANQFIGPPLGGLLVAAGAVISFATPSALWLVAVGALFLVRGDYRILREKRTSMRADIAEGLRFLWRNRVLRTLAIMTGAFNLASSAAFAVFVLYGVGPGSAMRLTDAGYGILLTSTAVGSLLGSFLAERVERLLGRAKALMASIVGSAVLIGMPALTASPYLVGAAFFVGGVAVVIWNVIAVSLRQRVTPDRLLGRVNSGYRLVAWGTMPLGAAIGGALAELFGLPMVFAIMAVAILALLALMTILTDRAMDAAEQESAG